MNYDSLRQIMARIGVSDLPTPNEKGWLHIACLLAPWTHRRGVDRSRGMALKVEDTGISAYVCPACKNKGRVSQLVRTLGVYQKRDLNEVADAADRFDVLGSELPAYDDHYSGEEKLPEPLDESMATGMFDRIGRYSIARDFMTSRRVSSATCDKLKIEFDPDKRRVVFPVRNGQGRLYGWSGRAVLPEIEPKVLDYAGLPKRHLILGEERWRPGKPKLLVEGLFAYARMHEIGAEEYVDIGALLGSTLTEEKANILLGHGCLVYAMTDPDKAGAECLYGQWVDPVTEGGTLVEGHYQGSGLIDRLAGEIPVRVPYYPQGVTDIDDITLPQLLHALETAPMQFPAKRGVDKKSRSG